MTNLETFRILRSVSGVHIFRVLLFGLFSELNAEILEKEVQNVLITSFDFDFVIAIEISS